MEKLTPIEEKERIKVIDSIRGFAILGIFLVNMQDFIYPWLFADPISYWDHQLDRGTAVFIDIFAQASFYTLFSFLFGFGTFIFRERAIEKGYKFIPLYSRRLLVLLLIGSVHAFLIWHGDILISYALIGFMLIPFAISNPKTILIWSLSLILIPSLIMGALLFSTGYIHHTNELAVEQLINVYGSGSYAEITVQRVNDWLYVNGAENFIFLILVIFPMFLLGYYFAKKGWFHNIENHLRKIKIIWLISLAIGTLFKLLPYFYEQKLSAYYYIQDSVGGPATAVFYATSIVLLSQTNKFNNLLNSFSYIGRLSLSNYLFQSVLCTSIFYGYGLGLYGQVRLFYAILFALLVYSIQIILSKQWLNKFNIGPMEWLWKSLTYGTKQSMRKKEISNV